MKLARTALTLGALSLAIGFQTVLCHAQEPAPSKTAPAATSQEPESAVPKIEEEATAPAVQIPVVAAPGTQSAASGASLRNENVFAPKVDTESQKLDDVRLGINYHLVSPSPVEVSGYASEYGQFPGGAFNTAPIDPVASWHAELYELLRNSVTDARAFFQVGGVKPAHQNSYGSQFSGKLPGWGFLSGDFAQLKSRGEVNGNILVPLPTERTPLATDPQIRAIISRYLAAFPAELPNRTDIDPRALNTNAPQTINSINASLRLQGNISQKHGIVLSDIFNRQTIDAFQLEAGQNPDTAIHSQDAQATYNYLPNAATGYSLDARYIRQRTALTSPPGAVGPTVAIGSTLTYLGPAVFYPIDRAENSFIWGASGFHSTPGGVHRMTFGADLKRYQMNGIEQNLQRGYLTFFDNFGNSAMTNFLLGLPTSYSVNLGSFNRGYRTWTSNAYFADQWKVSPNFEIYAGLRQNVTSAPTEVNHLDRVPYGTDWNNFSPRLALTYRGSKNWVASASYTVAFGSIYPVTFSQIRYNAPNILAVNVFNPNLVDPLAGVDLASFSTARTQPTVFSPNLVDPYTHQYNARLERQLGAFGLELGYIGSRSKKIPTFFLLNRALNIPGVVSTTANIDARRPDPRYYNIIDIVSAGDAYLDAGYADVRLRGSRGFSANVNFTLSKALDTGSNYASNAANNELYSPSQSQYNSLKDLKGPSTFDSPYSLTVYTNYQTPAVSRLPRALSRLTQSWVFSAILVARSGTPFTVFTGSDAPGYGNVDGSGGDRPNILDPSILGATVGNPDTSAQILSPSKFSYIAAGQDAGNLGSNTFRKGAILNLNGSVSREWRLSDRFQRVYTVRFVAEAFNAGNHPQFDAPNNNLVSPSFGRITNTLNGGRSFQFGLHLLL